MVFASGLSIADVDAIYPDLTIRDFQFRETSALLGNGNRFNLGIPTYQQPMSEVATGINAQGDMTLDSTEYFPTSGHLLIRNNSGVNIDTLSVISYTGKSGTTLSGCQLVRGASFPQRRLSNSLLYRININKSDKTFTPREIINGCYYLRQV